MAIQNRRGPYNQFDTSKMLPGEWAVVTSGDNNSVDGTSVYMCFGAGNVKRMATYEDMVKNIEQASAEMIKQVAKEAVSGSVDDCRAATEKADAAALQASTSAEAAEGLMSDIDKTIKESETAAGNANAAAAAAEKAAEKANAAAEKALAAAGGAGVPQVARFTLLADGWNFNSEGTFYMQDINVNSLVSVGTHKKYAVCMNVDYSGLGHDAPKQLGAYCNCGIVPCSIAENTGVLHVLAKEAPTGSIPVVALVWEA